MSLSNKVALVTGAAQEHADGAVFNPRRPSFRGYACGEEERC